MNPVLRGVVIYLFILIMLRFTGKRTLAESTTFDFVLLLIISEATQQSLLGEDFSLTNTFILIATLISVDIVLAKLKMRFPKFDKLTEGEALLLMADGTIFHERLKKVDIELDDILQAARTQHGLHQLKQIRYAVLERSGDLSIIPHESKS